MDAARYALPAWASLLLALAIAAAWLLLRHRLRRSRRWQDIPGSQMFLPVATVIALGLLLRVGTDHVRIDSQRIVERSVLGARDSLYLHGLESVTITRRSRVRSRAGRRSDEIWTGTYRDGRAVDVEPGLAWTTHRAELVARLRERGVAVHDQR